MILSNQADRVRAIRDILQVSQGDLARQLHTSQARVSAWERKGRVSARHMVAMEDMLRARDRTLNGAPPLLRLQAFTVASQLLREAQAGALVSRHLQALATELIAICERG